MGILGLLLGPVFYVTLLHGAVCWFIVEMRVQFHISPHCDTTMGILGLLLGPVGTFSIFLSTSSPSITRPEKENDKIESIVCSGT